MVPFSITNGWSAATLYLPQMHPWASGQTPNFNLVYIPLSDIKIKPNSTLEKVINSDKSYFLSKNNHLSNPVSHHKWSSGQAESVLIFVLLSPVSGCLWLAYSAYSKYYALFYFGRTWIWGYRQPFRGCRQPQEASLTSKRRVGRPIGVRGRVWLIMALRTPFMAGFWPMMTLVSHSPLIAETCQRKVVSVTYHDLWE